MLIRCESRAHGTNLLGKCIFFKKEKGVRKKRNEHPHMEKQIPTFSQPGHHSSHVNHRGFAEELVFTSCRTVGVCECVCARVNVNVCVCVCAGEGDVGGKKRGLERRSHTVCSG